MPTDRIETQRLRIRSFQPNDWQAVYDYTSDPDVMAYIPEGPFTPEQAKAFVADNMGERARFVAVLLKTDDMLVGHMEFHPWFAPQTYEIGWIGSSLPVNPRTLLRAGLWKNWACDERPTFERASGVRIIGGGTNTSMLY
jgi:RimJ/RimL family protein N-acetyltransferase